jgi:hypothetical protein
MQISLQGLSSGSLACLGEPSFAVAALDGIEAWYGRRIAEEPAEKGTVPGMFPSLQ